MSLDDSKATKQQQLNLPYALCELLVAVCAILGNGLVILVFGKERKLRRRTNYYIISLAWADLLVGLFAIPFAILESIGLPRNLHACLFTVSVLVVLCTISIFCLVAVSVDRYWAILHPMGYSRTVRTKTAIAIICACWAAGTLVGFLPLLGWNAGYESSGKCKFTEVMDYDYLLFLYFATIIFPALLIGAFYAHIYRVVVKQLQQIVTMNPGRKRKQSETHGTMLRLLGAAQKRDVKATQNLSVIVVFFIVCWFPLYTINCVQAFCPRCQFDQLLLDFCIILSHLNSAGNPLLYAYHLKDFRAALKTFIQRMLFPASAAAGSFGARAPRPVAGERRAPRATDASPRSPAPRALRNKSGGISAISGCASNDDDANRHGSSSSSSSNSNDNNDNNDKDNGKSNNSNNSDKRKGPLVLSSPESVLGCRSDAPSWTCHASTPELKAREFETAALQFADCDDDEDINARAAPASMRSSMLVVEADVNRCGASTSDCKLSELPSGKPNLDQSVHADVHG